jgi:DNA polymerase-3 subunit epsilon
MSHETDQSQKPAPPRGSWPRLPPFPRVNRQRGLTGPHHPDQSIGLNGASCDAVAEIERMQNQNEHYEDLVRRLEASGDYKILRRLVPRLPTPLPAGSSDKIGIIVDFETTGLDCARDEIIEAAMLKFRYSSSGEVTGVTGSFQSFNQPTIPIPAEVVELTGITDEMVSGHKIDAAALEGFVANASVIIAHNAGFDRKFAERSWDIFRHRSWACSASGIEWQSHGFSGAKLSYLLTESGFFHDAHRALDDCHATLEILARKLSATSTTALASLLERARRKTFRIWAEDAPFALKDALKRRLSLSETRSGRIGGAIRPKLERAEYGPRSRWGGLPENPYSRRGAPGFDCSSLRKIEVNAEDAARQIRRHDQGNRVGSSRSASHNTRSATAIAARWDDPECPSLEVAAPQYRRTRNPGHE